MSVWTSVLILSNSDWNYVTPGKGECGKESVYGRIQGGGSRVCMGRQKGITANNSYTPLFQQKMLIFVF